MYGVIAAKELLWCMLWRHIKTMHNSNLNSNKSFNIQKYWIQEYIYDFPNQRDKLYGFISTILLEKKLWAQLLLVYGLNDVYASCFGVITWVCFRLKKIE